MHSKILFILLSFIPVYQGYTQPVQSGKIVTGFIECIVLDSTENVLMEAAFMNQAASMMPKETTYFNEKYIITVKSENNNFSLMDYEDRNTGLIYTMYKDSNQKVYSIDSTNLYFLRTPEMEASLDSVKNRVERIYSSSEIKMVNGFHCFEMTNPEKPKNTEGYQKIYLTKDLGLPIPGATPTSYMDAYPVRTEIAASPGLEVAMGILESTKLSPDDPIFTLDLEKYRLVSLEELTTILETASAEE